MAGAGCVLWGGATLVVGLVNRLLPGYGYWYLKAVESLYPGYHVGMGLKNLGIGFLFSLLDGAVAGALLAWLYNCCAGKCRCAKEKEGEQKCC
jgi:hypothetical protein